MASGSDCSTDAVAAYSRPFKCVPLMALAIAIVFAVPTLALDVEHLFDVYRIGVVRLSPNGQLVAYSAAQLGDRWSVSWGGSIVQVNVLSIQTGTDFSTGELEDASDFQWAPDNSALIFSRQVDESTELRRFNLKTRTSELIVSVPGSIDKFRINDLGDISFTSRGSVDRSLYERMKESPQGLEVDVMRMSIYDLIDPKAGTFEASPASLYIVVRGENRARRLPIEGSVRDFHWGADPKRLSLVIVLPGDQHGMFEAGHTSIAVLDLATNQSQVIARYSKSHRTYYEGGEWTPSGRSLLVRRVAYGSLESHYQQYAFVRSDQGLTERTTPWRALESYPLDQQFIVIGERSFFYANTVAGVHRLMLYPSRGPQRLQLPLPKEGQSSHFSFSRNRDAVVYINQAVDCPPELFHSTMTSGATRRISSLNQTIVNRGLGFTGRSVGWKSRDGHQVQGWLLEPESAAEKPWPLLTFVHGGPTAAHRDEFASGLEAWPYPLESLAAAGVAVFIPNYRGTATFGVLHERVDAIDGAPVQDILSGIDELVRLNIADETRLALAGHSHGGWLGPMVWTEVNRFKAVSFAEGWSNWPVIYEAMPAQLNIDVHDTMVGSSYYERPERYNQLSPDLRMSKAVGACLLEAGAQNGPLFMFGMAKAAKRNGLDTTFIVYPNTGHTIEDKDLRRESANRNMQFFARNLLNNVAQDVSSR